MTVGLWPGWAGHCRADRFESAFSLGDGAGQGMGWRHQGLPYREAQEAPVPPNPVGTTCGDSSLLQGSPALYLLPPSPKAHSRMPSIGSLGWPRGHHCLSLHQFSHPAALSSHRSLQPPLSWLPDQQAQKGYHHSSGEGETLVPLSPSLRRHHPRAQHPWVPGVLVPALSAELRLPLSP